MKVKVDILKMGNNNHVCTVVVLDDKVYSKETIVSTMPGFTTNKAKNLEILESISRHVINIQNDLLKENSTN